MKWKNSKVTKKLKEFEAQWIQEHTKAERRKLRKKKKRKKKS